MGHTETSQGQSNGPHPQRKAMPAGQPPIGDKWMNAEAFENDTKYKTIWVNLG
jgi:hypothetical protein